MSDTPIIHLKRDRLWFVSDLHLDLQTPVINQHFLQFLELAQTRCDALFLLGDIFETWVGDDLVDTQESWLHDILNALKQTSQHCDIYVSTGNRDFLIGQKLCSYIHAHALHEQTIVQTKHERFVICHGDELCTDDEPYQRFRQQVREKKWQHDFLSQDLITRQAIARHARQESEQSKQLKQASIMDVNQQAVQTLLSHTNTYKLIHGHTHRPDTHRWTFEENNYERWVLPNWEESAGQLTHSGYLSIESGLWQLHRQ